MDKKIHHLQIDLDRNRLRYNKQRVRVDKGQLDNLRQLITIINIITAQYKITSK
jgi:hypothetical protein